jgi:adenine-specific DNA methylase
MGGEISGVTCGKWALKGALSGKSEKALCDDPVMGEPAIACVSATELSTISNGSYDLVVTDPPFGGLLHYADLADFFASSAESVGSFWLR